MVRSCYPIRKINEALLIKRSSVDRPLSCSSLRINVGTTRKGMKPASIPDAILGGLKGAAAALEAAVAMKSGTRLVALASHEEPPLSAVGPAAFLGKASG